MGGPAYTASDIWSFAMLYLWLIDYKCNLFETFHSFTLHFIKSAAVYDCLRRRPLRRRSGYEQCSSKVAVVVGQLAQNGC